MTYSGSVNDNILDSIRNNEIDFIPNNPYIKRARELTDTLFTIEDIVNDKFLLSENIKAPIVLEIGSYTGETILNMAKLNPKVDFIGVDIVFKRVVKTAIKIEKNNINNAKILIGDGFKLLKALPGKSISGICVFFPDPWIKKKKKRLINEDFLNVCKFVLKENGFVWIKTDNDNYYKSINQKIKGMGFELINDYPEILKPIDYPTYFESLFKKQDEKIYRILLKSK